MKNKLAGRLSLQEAIENTLAETKAKLAAAKGEPKPAPVAAEKPAPAEAEKVASASPIDPTDPEEVEKLAAALDEASTLLLKEADSVELGGESHQGGEVLPTARPVGGTQPYKHDKPKGHAVPMSTGSDGKPPDQTAAGTIVPTNLKSPVKGKMPPNVLRKMGAVEALKAAVEKQIAPKAETKVEEPKPEAKVEEKPAEKAAAAEPAKEQTAVDYILGKLSSVENGGESKQGGEQLSNSAPVPSNPGRQLIANNKAPVSATKRVAKAPRKAELAQVLSEPAFSKAHDSKVHENLRNATKGGVKIAAAKALLAKIAAEGCQCGGDVTCRYCKMQKAAAAMKATKAETETKDETASSEK